MLQDSATVISPTALRTAKTLEFWQNSGVLAVLSAVGLRKVNCWFYGCKFCFM